MARDTVRLQMVEHGTHRCATLVEGAHERLPIKSRQQELGLVVHEGDNTITIQRTAAECLDRGGDIGCITGKQQHLIHAGIEQCDAGAYRGRRASAGRLLDGPAHIITAAGMCGDRADEHNVVDVRTGGVDDVVDDGTPAHEQPGLGDPTETTARPADHDDRRTLHHAVILPSPTGAGAPTLRG